MQPSLLLGLALAGVLIPPSSAQLAAIERKLSTICTEAQDYFKHLTFWSNLVALGSHSKFFIRAPVQQAKNFMLRKVDLLQNIPQPFLSYAQLFAGSTVGRSLKKLDYCVAKFDTDALNATITGLEACAEQFVPEIFEKLQTIVEGCQQFLDGFCGQFTNGSRGGGVVSVMSKFMGSSIGKTVVTGGNVVDLFKNFIRMGGLIPELGNCFNGESGDGPLRQFAEQFRAFFGCLYE